jgi:predicted Zn finger-like uncharacterized protein
MIITCPECDARFVVPSTVFMRGGRKMKCASCAHTWFQDEPLEKSEAVKKFARDLDKGQKKAKKLPGEGFFSTLKQEIIDGKFFVIGGFSCAMIIFFIVQLLSSAPLVMGQGLAFHNIEIKRDNGDMTLVGEIVNTMNEKRGVPTLQIAELLHDDLLGNTHLIKPEKEILNADETLKITLQLPAIGREVRNLKIGFEGNAAKKEEDAHH